MRPSKRVGLMKEKNAGHSQKLFVGPVLVPCGSSQQTLFISIIACYDPAYSVTAFRRLYQKATTTTIETLLIYGCSFSRPDDGFFARDLESWFALCIQAALVGLVLATCVNIGFTGEFSVLAGESSRASVAEICVGRAVRW
jgi:hypothetical protein